MTDITWMQQGICRGRSQLFDPIPHGTRETPRAKARVRKALAVCYTPCPVLEQCAIWSLRYYDDDEAIVGGMTGPDRRRIRRELGFAKPRVVLADDRASA